MKEIIFDAAHPVKMTEAAKKFEGNEKAMKALKTAIEIAKLVKGKVIRNAADDGFIIRTRDFRLFDGYVKCHKNVGTYVINRRGKVVDTTPVWTEWRDDDDKRDFRNWYKPYKAEGWWSAAGGGEVLHTHE